MSRQSGRGDRPAKPGRFNPSDGAKPPNCSQASGWDSSKQIEEDRQVLQVYVNHADLLALWSSNCETAGDAYKKLLPEVDRNCPDLLDALKRIYCSRKNQ